MDASKEFIESLDRKEHPLKAVYPFCLKVFDKFEQHGMADLFTDSATLQHLYVNGDAEHMRKAYACRTIANVLAVLCIALFLSLALAVKESSNPVIDAGRLARAGTGEGSTSYDLIAVNSETNERMNVTVDVSEVRCEGEALEELFERAFTALQELVPGNNQSVDCITGNLNLVDSVPGTSVSVSWPELDHNYVFSNGTVRHDEIEEPVIISLIVRLTYFDETRLYSFPVRLMPPEKNTEESFEEKLSGLLKQENSASGGTEWFLLPTDVDGTKVVWSEDKTPAVLWITLLGLAAACAVVPAAKDELKRKDKARIEQMQKDYPEIVSKFVLLIGAGMTCRGAWEKICRDYIRAKEDHKTEGCRYAYEEMLRSMKDLRLGIPEGGVYEEFGKRTGVAEYRRLGTLLANNLRRGSSDIIIMLERESEDAFSERKSLVQMKAEEAGTKLLLPMLGMLCIVIAIVVVPAFTAFAG